MLIASLVLTAICVAALVLRERDHQYAIRGLTQDAQRERSQLLDRIQHPERPITHDTSMVDVPEPEEPDEFDRVGTIVNNPEQLLAISEGGDA